MRRQNNKARVSTDAVLRLAQNSVHEAVCTFAKRPARAHTLCTTAIRAIQDAHLHDSPITHVRKEARSTLSLAFQQRAFLARRTCVGDRAQLLPDAQAAVDMASCADDALSAYNGLVMALLLHPECVAELPAACDRLEAAMARRREAPKMRFMRPFPPTMGLCTDALRRGREVVARARAQKCVEDGAGSVLAREHEQAVASYTKALEALEACDLDAPHSKAAVLSRKARSLFNMGRLEEAAADAKLAVQALPINSFLHREHAHFLQQARHPRAACLALMRAAKSLPSAEDFLEEVPAFASAGEITEEDITRAFNPSACALCRKSPGSLQKCGRCLQVLYCCKEHQRADWRRHKHVCAALTERAASRPEPVTYELLSALPPAALDASKPAKRSMSLRHASSWDAFAKGAALQELQPPWRMQLLREVASYPLTLAAAVVAFELDKRRSICVHLVNIELKKRVSFDASAAIMSRLAFPDTELVFCGITSLSTPSVVEPDGERHLSAAMSAGGTVTVSTTWSVWHEAAHELPPADLVVGFDVDLKDVTYEWLATLRALVARGVPCVFTVASEVGYERALGALRTAEASLAFHGPAPFASPWPACRLGELEYANSFWIAFRGGQT